MSESTADPNVVRGRCACGKRYRIRHARANVVVKCPACGRMIRITEADLRGAQASVPLAPLQGDPAGLREAVPLDHDELRLATAGSRPGATGRVVETEEDLARAIGREPYASARPTNLGRADQDAEALRALPTRTLWSGFARDLLASLYLTGRPRNFGALGAITLVCAIPFAVADLIAPWMICLAIPLLFLARLIAGFSLIQFTWRTLTRTAGGDDDIPLFEADWDWLDDGVKPALWLLGVSLFCYGPALYVEHYVPGSSALLVNVLEIAGSFLWPVAVMSVALGESILALRPDWLVRCIFGIGPPYVLAWGLVVGTWYGSDILIGALEPLDAIPIAGPIVFSALYFVLVLYMLYVVFRTIGLLYRHFHHRLPWQF